MTDEGAREPRAPSEVAAGPPQARGFGARLTAAVASRESQIVVGIDPDPARLWPQAASRAPEARARLAEALGEAESAAHDLASHEAPGTRAAAARALAPGAAPRAFEAAVAVLAHSLALVDAAAPACVAAKPQLAFFEQLGFPGWLALEQVCARAREAGLLVLADGKRGDVPSTAAAYARALGPGGLAADAVTANPLMGRDAVEPLIAGARAARGGVFLLVRTSNPGAADVLDLPLATGEPLWERLAVMTAELGEGEELADVGAVTGTTVPAHLARMRELMPRTPFLLPGIGAQGGDVGALGPAFAPGRAAGLVSASRSIANAHEQDGKDPATAARTEAERLREAAWRLV